MYSVYLNSESPGLVSKPEERGSDPIRGTLRLTEMFYVKDWNSIKTRL